MSAAEEGVVVAGVFPRLLQFLVPFLQSMID